MHYSELEISVKFVNENLKGVFINNVYRHKYGTLFKLYGSEIKGLFFSREKKVFFPVKDISIYERESIGKIEEALRKYLNGKRVTGAEVSSCYGKSVTLFLGNIDLYIRLSTAFLPVIAEKENVIWPHASSLPEKVSLNLKYFPPATDNALEFSDIFLKSLVVNEEKEKYRLFNKEKSNIEKNISLFRSEIEKASVEGHQLLNKASLLKMWLYTLDSSSKQKIVSLYDMEGNKINIDLNPSKTVVENMNHFYKLAAKYKKGEVRSKEMLKIYELKLKELSIEDVSLKKEDLSSTKRKEIFSHKPYHVFVTPWNSVFFVGKTSADNDELTFKISSPYDIWFHAKDYSGSHVILRKKKNSETLDKDLLVGFMLAINYSKAKKGGEGEVWYSERKFIRKSKGMARGAVLITRGKSKYVIFDQKIMDSLNKE